MKKLTISYTLTDQQYSRLEALFADTQKKHDNLTIEDELEILLSYTRQYIDGILDLEESVRGINK